MNSARSPPPPPLHLVSVSSTTSFVFTSSQYQPSSPPSRHSRNAFLSARLLENHASGAFDARTSPESLLPPGFVQLNPNTTNTTAKITQAPSSEPVPSSSRPLWLPRFASGVHQPSDPICSTASESPTHDRDSYFPSQPGTSTGNTSPLYSATSSPIQFSSPSRLPASPRRTTGEAAHELSLTELVNGTDVFGSSVYARDRAGPRYQTMPRLPRPSPNPRNERKSKDKRQLYFSDAIGDNKSDAIENLKLVRGLCACRSSSSPAYDQRQELQHLSATTGSLPETKSQGLHTQRSAREVEP